MSARAEHIAALRSFGYTESEAQFLYQVATHSGYFTLRHLINFRKQPKGWYVSELTRKIRRLRHAWPTIYGRNAYIFNLYSRRLYAAIDKENLRHRRRLSNELIRTRLYILDFVLANPDQKYFETEAEKVRYFHDELGLPLPVLPGRIYKGLNSNLNTKRYFVDRFPIFIPSSSNSLSLAPVITFLYCDSGDHSLAAYFSHLRAYEKLLFRVSAFNFIYAAPEVTKFKRAAEFFSRILQKPGRVDARRLVEYFRIRFLWETHRHALLTRADRDVLRDGDQRYSGEPFESTYQKWLTTGLTDQDVEALLGTPGQQPERTFRTYVLPEKYDIFWTESAAHFRT